jgi:CheY-like chemotaxis protein
MTTAPLRVLVVDDSVDTARMMKLLLKQQGHEATTAFDGTGAIEVARAFRPDAVLLDLTLPDMSGSEVAEQFKGIPELSGCILVAVTDYDAETLGTSSPFEHHFKKPVDHEALAEFLSEIRVSPRPSGQSATSPA